MTGVPTADHIPQVVFLAPRIVLNSSGAALGPDWKTMIENGEISHD